MTIILTAPWILTSQENTANKKKAADSQFFRFEITTEEEESMGIRALCYTKIKELLNWSDAEDC